MSSVKTILTNSNAKDADIRSLKIPEEILNELEISKASIEKLDISKCEEFPEAIAAIGNKLNEVIEFFNANQVSIEISKEEFEKAKIYLKKEGI